MSICTCTVWIVALSAFCPVTATLRSPVSGRRALPGPLLRAIGTGHRAIAPSAPLLPLAVHWGRPTRAQQACPDWRGGDGGGGADRDGGREDIQITIRDHLQNKIGVIFLNRFLKKKVQTGHFIICLYFFCIALYIVSSLSSFLLSSDFICLFCKPIVTFFGSAS